MNSKKIIISCILSVILLCGGISIVHGKANEGYSASMAIACIGQEYMEELDGRYLTFAIDTLDGPVTKRIKVDGSEIEEALSSIDAQEVIGLLIFLEIPNQLILEKHLDTGTIDAFRLLTDTDMYDDYFRIVDYSIK